MVGRCRQRLTAMASPDQTHATANPKRSQETKPAPEDPLSLQQSRISRCAATKSNNSHYHRPSPPCRCDDRTESQFALSYPFVLGIRTSHIASAPDRFHYLICLEIVNHQPLLP